MSRWTLILHESVDSNFNFLRGRPRGAGPPVDIRPPEPDPLPLRVDVINGWPLSYFGGCPGIPWLPLRDATGINATCPLVYGSIDEFLADLSPATNSDALQMLDVYCPFTINPLLQITPD